MIHFGPCVQILDDYKEESEMPLINKSAGLSAMGSNPTIVMALKIT